MSAATVSRYYATGKRKNSIARVWMMPGSGKITINDKSMDQYFGRDVLKMIIRQPFEVTGTQGQVRCARERARRRQLRPGRRHQARHFQGAARRGRRIARQAAQGRASDPRPQGQRAQEVRPEGRTGTVPVLEEIRDHIPICSVYVADPVTKQGKVEMPSLLFCSMHDCRGISRVAAGMSDEKLKIAIVGSSGYTGGELYADPPAIIRGQR